MSKDTALNWKELTEAFQPLQSPMKETEQQRRIRLIEQYAGMIWSGKYRIFDRVDSAELAIAEAKLFADAVIEATKEGK